MSVAATVYILALAVCNVWLEGWFWRYTRRKYPSGKINNAFI